MSDITSLETASEPTHQLQNLNDVQRLFDRILQANKLFTNHDLLRSTHIPETLPHREKEITELASILSPALNYETPSNIIIFGKPGVGKTAAVKLVGKELERKAIEIGKLVNVVYINCQYTDTLYRILNNLAQHFINSPSNDRPFTGLPTDEVYVKTLSILDMTNRAIIIVLDEIDRLKEDAALYLLTRINNDLHNTKVSIIGISNNLRFTDFLDARVKSSLGQETMVFNPYDAQKLQDILRERAKSALKPDVIEDDIIPLCAALAAREHGDARKALDLLRISAEIAERKGDPKITKNHVRLAQKKIESDCTKEIVHNLPFHSKLVIIAILKTQKEHKEAGISEVMMTGEVYDYYRRLCEKARFDSLTQRRCADFISELDSLGLITARVISKGRQGRTKEITLSASATQIIEILQEDEMLRELLHYNLKNQTRII